MSDPTEMFLKLSHAGAVRGQSGVEKTVLVLAQTLVATLWPAPKTALLWMRRWVAEAPLYRPGQPCGGYDPLAAPFIQGKAPDPPFNA
jgi:hypothetical protein